MTDHQHPPAQFAECDRRAQAAQGAAAQAVARLLRVAQTRDTGQAGRVARFLASTYDGAAFPFDLSELRAVDVEISDDMLACIDAIRWGRADLWRLLPHGDEEVERLIDLWQLGDAREKRA